MMILWKTILKQKQIFKKTLNWVNDRIQNGTLNNTSALLAQEAMGTLRSEINQYFKRENKQRKALSYIRNGYLDYVNKDVFKSNKGIKKVSIKDLKPKFRKELENRVLISMNLIKNRDNELKQRLASRFLNWVTIDSDEVRGKTTSGNSLLRFLDFAKENGIAERHARFIIEDQTRKMIADFDMLVAKENNAVGCIWKTRQDKRVVGNPNGLYPNGNLAHNDHWDRQDKFFVFKDSWAFKNGMIRGEIYENLEDGGVGVAIGCRCRLEIIYDLRDAPFENLTNKGREYVKSS